MQVVEGQVSPAGIITAPIDEVDGHAAALLAAVREHDPGQGPDLLRCEVGAEREQAETAFAVFAGGDAADVLAAVVDRQGVLV